MGDFKVSCMTSVATSDGSNTIAVECGSTIFILVSILIPTAGPYVWRDLYNISISISIPPDTNGVFLYLWNAKDAYPNDGTILVELPYSQFVRPISIRIPLLRGAQLFGLLTWKKRRLITGGKPAVHSSLLFLIPVI